MNISRRILVTILFLPLAALAGLLFWPFIFDQIIHPSALAVWLLLRIFVLSVDQIYYWGAMILIALVFLLRLAPEHAGDAPARETLQANESLAAIDYWRSLFTLKDTTTREERTLKRELIHLVASLYASKQHSMPDFIFYEALERGEISLPDRMHAFLFPQEPKQARRSPKEWLHLARETTQRKMRHWTGQETAENYRMIDEVLRFVETSLEMENDDRNRTPNEN